MHCNGEVDEGPTHGCNVKCGACGTALTRQLMKGILTTVHGIACIEFINNFNERAHTSQVSHSIFLIEKSWLKDKWQLPERVTMKDMCTPPLSWQ